MASTFRNQYGDGRLGMGSEPLAEEWEQTFGADLLPHLVPAEQLTAAATTGRYLAAGGRG